MESNLSAEYNGHYETGPQIPFRPFVAVLFTRATPPMGDLASCP